MDNKSPSNPSSGSDDKTPVNSGKKKCPYACEFDAKIKSVTFESPIKICRKKKTVKKPHWKKGTNVNDGSGSKRAAAYLIKGKSSHNVTVEIKVTKSKNCSGPAKLKGFLSEHRGKGKLEIDGDCPVSVGTHKVSAKITNPSDCIQWYRGDITWALTVSACKTVAMETTRAELFFILDTPISVYQNHKGDWVEALRFVCEKAGVEDVKKKIDAAAKIDTYCHTGHGLKYDTTSGGSKYNVKHDGGSFHLGDFLSKKYSRCNCYDMAAAISSLSGAAGVELTWLFLQPFGFLKQTDLIGIGQCNNPFFASNGSAPIVAANDKKRIAFGNHAFCELSSKVHDACAGPHKGTETRAQYIDVCIEKKTDTTLYSSRRPGKESDIVVRAGVTKVE